MEFNLKSGELHKNGAFAEGLKLIETIKTHFSSSSNDFLLKQEYGKNKLIIMSEDD